MMSQQQFKYDRWILVPAVLLMVVGLLMVASASMVISDQSYGQPFHFLFRQCIYYVMGIIIACVAIKTPMSVWQAHNRSLMAIGLFL